jgi:hypothetical protein
VVAKLEKGDPSLLISLVTLETEKRHKGDESIPSYGQRLISIRNKLLAILTKTGNLSSSGNGDLPEFREYARNKYGAELDEDLITTCEGRELDRMTRQPGR